MMSEAFKESLRRFIIERFMGGKGSVADEDSLFAAGILDSFGMLELIAFLEKERGLVVSPGEVTMDNFDSLERIMRLVRRKDKEDGSR